MNYIKYLVNIPFNICVHFLLGMGKVLHLNYVQISVIFNLWIQGTILMISGVIPFILYIYFVLTDKIALNIELLTAVGLMSILYIATYSIMLVHYRLCIPVDTRSPIPVIPVHSVGNLQYMWQS